MDGSIISALAMRLSRLTIAQIDMYFAYFWFITF
jgi:hypothetical protein